MAKYQVWGTSEDPNTWRQQKVTRDGGGKVRNLRRRMKEVSKMFMCQIDGDDKEESKGDEGEVYYVAEGPEEQIIQLIDAID